MLDRTKLHTYAKRNCLNKNCLNKLCGGNRENGGGGLPFKRPHVYIIQTGRETEKFKMAPATFYNHLVS